MQFFKLMFLLLLVSTSAFSSECEISPKGYQVLKKERTGPLKRYIKRNTQLQNPDCLGKLLSLSIQAKNKITIDYILGLKPNVNYEGKIPAAITQVILDKDVNLLIRLLKAGGDANSSLTINGKRIKAIDYAAENNLYPIVSALKKYGAKETLDCSLNNNMIPPCYHKRDKAIFKIALVYYGDSMKPEDLDRIAPLLKKRFYRATQKNVEVDIISKKVIPFKQRMPENYSYNGITDKKRLQRIWYYDNVGSRIMEEVYKEYKKITPKETMDQLDAIVSVVGGQFDGLGFASGRVAVTEYPREIAWATEGGGRVEYPSDYEVVDELIHELGHTMFLGHTSTQCQRPGLSIEQKEACCKESPSRNDVMSYCRSRSAVSKNFMHGFESCNIEMIEDLIVPAMLEGERWQVEPRQLCE